MSSQSAADKRAASDAQAIARLQGELSAAIADLATARDQLQIAEADLLRAQRQVRP